MARSLPLHGALPEPASRPRLAVAAKGFRPFFLLAAAFAGLLVPMWMLILRGVVAPGRYFEPSIWHAHEMVFGFAVAVIAGFLLTAVGNWTQRETAVGRPLLALAALWCLGRVAILGAGILPRGVPALVDLAFLPLLIAVLARPLVASKSRRNFVMLAILGALLAANVVVHLDALGLVAPGSARRACLVGVDVVVLVILIVSGRVFPMFTRSATGATSIRSILWLDVPTIAGMALVAALDAAAPESAFGAIAAGAVGVLAAARSVHWGARYSAGQPLLWILHVGYAWIPIGLVLRAAATFAPAIPRSSGIHALTVGAIGSLCLGMMSRVALGHTGRPLAPPKPIAWAFAALTAAAFARCVVPMVAPSLYLTALDAAAALWSVAFILFVVVYAPLLSRPRPDGKAG